MTLDKNQKGSDHKCSLEPFELKNLIDNVRELEIALGKPAKSLQQSEIPCFNKLGKTVVAAKCLEKGTILEVEYLKIKVAEPKGIDGAKIYSLVGKKLCKTVQEDESITENILENLL